MRAYIEIIPDYEKGAIWGGLLRFELTEYDLWSIGEFTRENILRWFGSGPIACRLEWGLYLGNAVRDFHAVCGDMDIPWATKEAGNGSC